MGIKVSIKRIVGHIVRAIPGSGPSAIAVLTYHSVGGGAPGSQPVAQFRAQVDWLSKHSDEFPVLPLRTALSPTTDGARVLITFDDGYRDNASIAAPILKEFGLCAAFFVSSGFIDGDRGITAGFKNYHSLPSMTWAQVAGLAECGHEIGLHGHQHASYAALSRGEAEDDMMRSYQLIRARTGYTPLSFAFPFGQRRHQRDDLRPIFQRLGIQYAFTSMHRRVDARSLGAGTGRLAIPRLRVDPTDSLQVFVEKIRGLWDWIAVVQEFGLLRRLGPDSSAPTVLRGKW